MKKVISWCIIFTLVFAYPFAARAALSNVVVGLQNGAGDVVELYGENLELILDARETALYNLNRVFAISIDAAGMWPALKGALQDSYNFALNTTEDVLRAIGYLFGDWITDANILAGNVYESAAEHCYVSEDGKLYFNGDFVDYVDEFLQWLWSVEGGGLIRHADSTVTTVTTVDNIPVYVMQPGDAYTLTGVDELRCSGNPLYITLYNYNGSYRVCAAKRNQDDNAAGNAVLGYYSGNTYKQGASVSYSWYMANGYFIFGQNTYGLPVSDVQPTGSTEFAQEVSSENVTYTEQPDIFSGMSSAEIDLSAYFDIAAADPATTGDWTITPKQLVQAVAESIAGDQSDQQITAVDGSGAQTVVSATPTGAELQPVEGSPPSGSSSFPTITTPSIDGNWNGVEGFQIDLSSVFPFCIPFDVYKLISKLSVDPVTPVFEIPVAVSERMGMYETVTVDLSPFDDFAASMRNLQKLLILAAVGVLSWKMIFGGD